MDEVNSIGALIFLCDFLIRFEVQGSPNSTVFVPPGNRTIEKTVLFGD